MIYKPIKAHPHLTLGKEYKEYFANPCPFNACVKNDDGKVEIIPRDEFFSVEGLGYE